jgi:uncharacterized protein
VPGIGAIVDAFVVGLALWPASPHATIHVMDTYDLPLRCITVFADAPDAAAGAVARTARDRLATIGYTAQSLRLALAPGAIPPTAASARVIEEEARAAGFDYVNLGPLPPAMAVAVILATEIVFASTLVATPGGPPDTELIAGAADAIVQIAHNTPQGFGNLRYCVAAQVSPGGPFFPAGYHAGGPTQIALGVEAAGLAQHTLATGGPAELSAAIGRHALRLEAALAGIPGAVFTGCDWSLAPHPDPERSAAAAIELLSGVPFGAWGTLSAVAQITAAIGAAQARRCGFNGVMLPVLEDATLAQRNGEGRFTLRDLLAFSAVCGTGLDTIPLPGGVSAEEVYGVLSEVATLATSLHKPLTARLMPIPGLRAGDMTAFTFAYFVNTPVMAL